MNLADLLEQAPAPTSATAPAPTGPRVSTPDFWQSEQITGHELAALAAKLLRRPGDDAQLVGRALFRALRGEPFAQQGHRNQTAYKIAGEVITEYPNCDPETVIACFSASISRVQQEGSKMTEEKWLGMLERLQDERRSRLNATKVAVGRIGRTLQEHAKDLTKPLPAAAAWVLESPGPRATRPAPAGTVPSGPGVPAFDPSKLNTLLIIADGTYYLRRPDESFYRWALKTERALAVELIHQFGTDNSTVFTRDQTGKAIPIADLVEVYASNAHRIVHDYSSRATTWDPARAALHVGLPDEPPEPELSPLVHEWLCALSGAAEGDGQVKDLYDWIASTNRDYIHQPAAGLVLVGPKDAGKSLLPLALGASWGVLPVKLENAVGRFNGSLLSSPFWWADERMPDDLSDSKYREIVQERSRLIEPKGREKVELRGCSRLIFTLNEPGDLRLGGLEGPSALEAVVDRIAFFDSTDNAPRVAAALEALRPDPNSYDVDLALIARHIRAIQLGLKPRVQRFLGAQPDRGAARKLVIGETVARGNRELIEALIDYLLNPEGWERAYHTEERHFQTGQRYPVITQAGHVWAWPKELATRLQQAGVRTNTSHTRAGLSVMRGGPRGGAAKQITFNARTLRADYMPLDLEKLLIAGGIEPGTDKWATVVQTCATDTRTRKGLPAE